MKKVILIGLIGLSSVVFGDDFSNKKSMLVDEVKTMKKLYTELDNCLTPTKNETEIKMCATRFQQSVQEFKNKPQKLSQNTKSLIKEYNKGGNSNNEIYLVDPQCPGCLAEVSKAFDNNKKVSLFYYPIANHKNSDLIVAWLKEQPENVVKSYFKNGSLIASLQNKSEVEVLDMLNKNGNKVKVSKDMINKVLQEKSILEQNYKIDHTPLIIKR